MGEDELRDALQRLVFMLPPNELVLWTMLAVALLLAAYWRVGAGRRFRGPAAG
jgi:hypothetical protein